MVLKWPALLAAAAATLTSLPARAERTTTREALETLEELLMIRIEDGVIDSDDVVPALVVSTKTRFEESADWFPTQALQVITTVFGTEAVRVCEACMQPRTFVRDGYIEQNSGPISIDEIVRLDADSRGRARVARSAIWVDEHDAGVAVKIVDLGTSRVIWAENVDPYLEEAEDTEDLMKMAREYERRARGDSLTQFFLDASFFPGQHVSLDWTDQWGETNKNFTGVSVSLFDPVVGIGAAYYRAFDLGSIFGLRLVPQIGAKVILSLPTAILQTVSDDVPDVIDPIITGVAVIRIPIGMSNYGLLITASTNGRVGVGISLLNVTFIPVIL